MSDASEARKEDDERAAEIGEAPLPPIPTLPYCLCRHQKISRSMEQRNGSFRGDVSFVCASFEAKESIRS